MLFNSLIQSAYYSLVIHYIFAFLIIILILLASSKFLPSGELEKRFRIISCYLMAGVGFTIIAMLGVPEEIRKIIFTISLSFSISFPIVLYASIAEYPALPDKNRHIFSVAAVFLFVIAALFGEHFPTLVIIIFLIIWISSIISCATAEKRASSCYKKNLSFHLAFAIFISGAGFIADIVFIGNIQEIPILTIVGALSSLSIVYSRLRDPDDKEPGTKDAAGYIAGILSIACAIFIFAMVRYIFTEQLNTSIPIFILYPMAAAIAGITALIPIKTIGQIEDYIGLFFDRYVDPFSSRVYRHEQESGRKLSLHELDDFIKESFNVEAIVWERKFNSREYTLISKRIAEPFSLTDRLIIGKKLLQILEEEGSVQITPVNIETFTGELFPFDKVLQITEKAGFLITSPVRVIPGYLPESLLTFYYGTPILFKPNEIKGFGRIARLFDKPRSIDGRNRYKWLDLLITKITLTENIEELVKIIKSDLSEFADTLGMNLFIEDDSRKWQIYNIVEFSSDISNINPENYLIGLPNEAGLIDVERESKSAFSLKILPITCKSSKAFIFFAVNPESFIHEPDDREFNEKISIGLGAQINRILMLKMFKEKADQIEEIARLAQQKIENQKHKVAENIHDTVIQEIYAARLQLSIIEKKLKNSPTEAFDDIAALKATISEGMKNARNLLKELTSSESVDEVNIRAELEAFIDRIKSESKINIFSSGIAYINNIPNDQAKEISLIIREIITNARKHSDANNLRISIRRLTPGLSIIILDDGKGFSLEDNAIDKSNHFGLSSIKSRTQRLGGKLRIKTAPGRGTAIGLLFINI